MASTFAGLSITQSARNAAQIGLSTTTNNMANTDTDGYSVQTVNQSAVGPAAVYSSSLVGNGVTVNSVDRTRSFRLDQKYWDETGTAGKLEVASDYLEQVESIYGTTSTSAITTDMNTFFTDLATLSTSNTDSSRKTVVEAAEALCETLNTTADKLSDLRSDLNNEVYTAVGEINSYATQIAELNAEITTATANGASTNELEDKRDLLVDGLSALADISVTSEDNGSYTITIEGANLVSGSKANELECYTVTDTASDQYGMYGVRWAGSTKDAGLGTTGSLNGYLEMRDSEETGIPYYTNQLDEITRTFAKAFNEGITVDGTSYSGHADSYTTDGETGIRFFTYDDLSSADMIASAATIDAAYENLTAANISISGDLQDDYTKVAIASTSTGGSSDNGNYADLKSICQEISISGDCTASELYSVMVSGLGTTSSAASNQYDRASARATYINTSRTSYSGVNSDEETVNMTKYEQAYDAACSMTSTWQEIYDATINMVK